MFWVICVLLTLTVGLAIAAPLRRGSRGSGAQSAASYDLRVYRDQLREVDRDQERGVIGADEAARLRNEIGRKVLDADRRLSETLGPAKSGTLIGAALALLVLLAGAVALYRHEGRPRLPDLPMAERIAASQRAYDSRPRQAEAEAAAPKPALPEVDAEYAQLVDHLRQAVAERPDDPQGLTLLATSEMRMGNIAAAREAQQQLVDLRGDKASAEELMRLSAMMMEAAGGLITPEAEEVLARSLKQDPNQPQARYLLGLLQLQNGRPDRAFPIWRRLLEEGPPDAPWLAPIRGSILELAWLAGQPDYVPPQPGTGPSALPGPDADAMTAAEDMTPEERQQMIGDMVARLEERLAAEGGTAEEWARLITSLAILGRTDQARDALARAQNHFAASPPAMTQIDRAAEQVGLDQMPAEVTE